MLVLGSLFHVKQRPQDHSLGSCLPAPVGGHVSAGSSFSLPAGPRSCQAGTQGPR